MRKNKAKKDNKKSAKNAKKTCFRGEKNEKMNANLLNGVVGFNYLAKLVYEK